MSPRVEYTTLLSAFGIAVSFAFFTYLFVRSFLFDFVSGLIARYQMSNREKHFWPRIAPTTSHPFSSLFGWASLPETKVIHIASIGIILAIALAFFMRSLSPLATALGCLAIFSLLVMLRARRAKRVFLEALPDALLALGGAMRVGYDRLASLELIERETGGHIQLVFGALARAERYRVPFSDAMNALSRELNLMEWNVVAQTLSAGYALGGNSIPILENIAHTLREKVRIDGEVLSATASGRFSGITIALLAPLSFAAFTVLAPEYMSVMTQSGTGQILLFVATLLEIMGFSVIWRIMNVDY